MRVAVQHLKDVIKNTGYLRMRQWALRAATHIFQKTNKMRIALKTYKHAQKTMFKRENAVKRTQKKWRA
jgi:hypothetical protein